MQESTKSEVRLHDISCDAVEQLVTFTYTSEITIGERNVQVSEFTAVIIFSSPLSYIDPAPCEPLRFLHVVGSNISACLRMVPPLHFVRIVFVIT